MNFAADIPRSLAVAAFAGTSFVPEKRGEAAIDEYAGTLQSCYEVLQANAQKGGTLEKLESEFAQFRAGYRKRYLAWLASRGNCMSTMIAGPSNFPVARAEKRNRIEGKRSEELTEFRTRALKAAVRNLRPDLRPIMAGDADAIERLEVEIAKAEAAQARMKAANAAIRANWKKGLPAVIAALMDLGFSEPMATELVTPDCMGGTGFASYSLSNNNANIRRMKVRLAQLAAAKAKPDTQVEGANGISISDCPAENRIRITFPGKPPAEVRAKLKSNGFRWAPSLGVWQAYRNSNSLAVAGSFAQGAA